MHSHRAPLKSVMDESTTLLHRSITLSPHHPAEQMNEAGGGSRCGRRDTARLVVTDQLQERPREALR